MIRGAIFDLDGTLLDSMSIWDTIGEDYLRSLGSEPRENLQETFATFTLEQAARYYQEHYGVALSVPEILRGIEDMVASAYRQTVPLKAGAADFLRALKERGVWTYAADGDGDCDLYSTDLTGSTAIVLGDEGKGISRLVRQRCDGVISIPMFGNINSLNVSVAGAVMMYEAVRRKLEKEKTEG